MSITPVAPAENSKGKVRTWVNSRWKFRLKPGQFSMKLNTEEVALSKLKLEAIADDRPVKLTFELPATIYRDLVAYGQVLARETGDGPIEPSKLIAPMLARFMATDRVFAKARRVANSSDQSV